MRMKTDILVRRLRNHDCQKCEVRGLCKDAGGEECLLPGIAAEAIKNLESTLSQANEKLDAVTRTVADLEMELRKARSEREYFRSRAAFFAVEAGANGKVISVEGYKAFRGTMRISPRGAEAYDLCGDWLYKPGTGCWYGNGRSFPKEVCTILERMEKC